MFSVTILQANVSFHIFRSMYYVTAVGKLKVKTVICLLDPGTGAVTIRPPRSHIIRDQCFTRSPLLEACNSHNKPIQLYFYRQSVRYFSREIGQFGVHEHASVKIKHVDIMNMSTS